MPSQAPSGSAKGRSMTIRARTAAFAGASVLCVLGAACAPQKVRPVETSEPGSDPGSVASGVGGSTMGFAGSGPGSAGSTGFSGPITCDNSSSTSMRPSLPPGIASAPAIPAVVTRATTSPPPLSGGTLLALTSGVAAVVSDPERDQIDVIDLAGNRVQAVVVLQPGDEPGRIVEDAAGHVHVALRRGGAVVSIDPITGVALARRAVCSAPRGLAYEPATDLLHVACAGGELVSLPAAGGAVTRTVTLDRDLRDVVVGANGNLLVSTFRHADVLVVGSDGVVSQRLAPSSGMAPPFLGPARNVSPAVAWRMVPRGDAAGSVVMLHQTEVDDAVDPAAGAYGGFMGCGAIVSPGVSVLTPGGTQPPVATSMSMVTLAIDLALSPDGSTIALAVAGNSTQAQGPTLAVTTLDTLTNAAANASACTNVTTMDGAQPIGQVVAVSYSASGLLLAQTREPATLWRSDTSVTIPIATDSRADTGHLIFHANAGGGLACASCHPEGGEDGRVWNFACLGLRRTQSIRGDISGTAPFHWDGAEADFSHLMDDVFTGRMSGPMLADDQKQALEGWVDTIKLLPPTSGLDAAAVARGQTLFNDAKVACASCHAGSLLTNNTTVDVGTGAALQVPSLRGVSWRAPFMHNGCAATLADRFDLACGGDKHGATSQLTTAQQNDLVAYLESL
jgi:mono/diheme cytochrome c family protein